MKYILFGNLDEDTKTVLKNIPYNIEYILTNTNGYLEFEGRKVYTSSKLYSEELNSVYVFITSISNYCEMAEQLNRMGLIEGIHFSGAIEYLFNQWNNIEQFDDIFMVRIKHMSTFLSQGVKSIVDLGCGKQSLLKFMDENIQYYGVDYIDRGNDTIICDFNQKEFPNTNAEVVFCSGCLEYIEDFEWFIRNMCSTAEKEILVSYCPLEYQSDIFKRIKYGWKNHLTINQLVRQFQRHGYKLILEEKSIGCNVVMKFINVRKNMIKAVQENKLTYLETDALEDLMDAVNSTNDVDGAIIETGCALGGSGICMAFEKAQNKELHIYDVFGMIPAPGEKDGKDVIERYNVIKDGKSQGINGDLYYGYQDNLQQTVNNNFCMLLGISQLQEKKITLIKGLFEDTLICEEPIALAHIDCDWYDSVLLCLKRIVPKLSKGGALVIDDYYHWSGAREAVDDYFRDKKELFDFEKKSRLHITRK